MYVCKTIIIKDKVMNLRGIWGNVRSWRGRSDTNIALVYGILKTIKY